MASTIINVAVPDMSRVFALGQERAQWLSAGFMGAMTLSMLTTPWLLARYGYRHAYTGAVVAAHGRRHRRRLQPAGSISCSRCASPRASRPACCSRSRRSSSCTRSAPASAARRWASSASASSSRRRSGRASAASSSRRSAGARSSSSSRRSACVAVAMAQRYLPIGAPGGAPISKSGGRLDVVGLGLIAVAVLALAERHGAPARRDAARSAWRCSPAASSRLVGFVLHQRRGARPLMALRAVRASRVRDGRRGRLHLRHGAVRLDLPGAGVHAG